MPQDLKGVEIFSTGTHRGSETTTITEADLDQMVASYDALAGKDGFKPVLKLGHEDAQKYFGQKKGAPNLGFVERIWREGSKILADFANVPNAVIDLIRNRRYNSVSIEMYPKAQIGGKTFANVLTAVALLGAELPAVKGLKELAASLFEEEIFGERIELDWDAIYYADIPTDERKALAKKGIALPDGSYPIRNRADLENAIQAFGRANPGDRKKVANHIRTRARALNLTNLLPKDGVLANLLKAEQEDQIMFTQEQVDALIAAAVQKAVDTAKAEFEAKVAELTAKAEKAETDKKEAQTALRSYAESAQKREVATLVEGAIKAGKITPAQKDTVTAIAMNLSGTVKFGDGEKSMSDLFKELIAGMGTKVDLSEHTAGGSGEDNRESGDTPADEVHKRTVALVEKSEGKLEYAQAYDKVLAANPDLKQRYFAMEG